MFKIIEKKNLRTKKKTELEFLKFELFSSFAIVAVVALTRPAVVTSGLIAISRVHFRRHLVPVIPLSLIPRVPSAELAPIAARLHPRVDLTARITLIVMRRRHASWRSHVRIIKIRTSVRVVA